MILFGSVDSTTISLNTVIYEFLLNLRELFTAGTAVHKLLSLFCSYNGISPFTAEMRINAASRTYFRAIWQRENSREFENLLCRLHAHKCIKMNAHK